MLTRSYYVAIEGIDGAGTTTHTNLLVSNLRKLGYCSFSIEEPSRGPIGVVIRELLKKGPFSQKILTLLFASDRLHQWYNIEKMKAEENCVIVGDRSFISSLVYQSYEDFPDAVPLEWVYEVNRYTLRPDMVIILDVDPAHALERLSRGRGQREKPEKYKYLVGLSRRYLYVAKILSRLLPVVIVREYDNNGKELSIDTVARRVLVATLALVKYIEKR